MKRIIALVLSAVWIFSVAFSQTPSTPQKPPQEIAPDDIIRITTNLVQTDVVVTDKNEQIIPDLKLEDFELYDNGKKQDIKFMEFVSVDAGRRSEGTRPASLPNYVEQTGAGLLPKDLKRVVAFVIDDLTMQFEDLPAVRKMLLNFVDNKMRDGDLVAIVRVVGGKGLLQQFTTDRQLLRRAIASIRIVAHPLGSSETPDDPKMNALAQLAQVSNPENPAAGDSPLSEQPDTPEIYSSNDDTIRYFRGLSALTTANFVINSLREIPGRKNLVIITGGIPIFEIGKADNVDITRLLNQLTNNAIRAGVVISSLDPRGLRASPGVKGFQATPAKSALGGNDPADTFFGRGDPGAESALGPMLAGASEHLGLSTVAGTTGGVSVVNTNNFEAGLDKILARSNGYYTLAYSPSEKFDRNFHKIEIKVKRNGTRVYSHMGYVAREEATSTAPRTKEEAVAAAARSPLAKNDIDVTPNVTVRLKPDNRASVDIHLLIDAKKLHFTENADHYQDSLDIVGFIFDQMGRNRGGFSETVNLNLTREDYQRALVQGLTYSAGTEVPPDYYQVRAIVREASSGSLGTFSKYLEVPDLTKGKLAMTSVFLFATDAQGTKAAPLLALRQLNRKQDLRYVAMIYNPKLKDGKPQLRSEMIISQGNKILFREPEQPVESNGSGPVTKIGQLGLSRVAPGRYVLTLVITDTLVDKKTQTQARSIDFTVVN
jgi:VWFA-related protein